MNNTQSARDVLQACVRATGVVSVSLIEPKTEGAAFALEIEMRSVLGVISFWGSGSMDWHMYEIETEEPKAVGVGAFSSLEELIEKIRAVLEECSR